MNELDLCLEID